MRIRAVDARFGGASHDSFVWNLSEIRQHLLEQRNTGTRNTWLLGSQDSLKWFFKYITLYLQTGDSGYPLEPWLITPYRSASEGSNEAKFNSVHSKARSIVERTIGFLKNRFRCLLGARQLHYDPKKAVKIINTCCTLHNICIDFGIDDTEIEDVLVIDPTEDSVDQESSNVSIQIRNQIMQSIVERSS